MPLPRITLVGADGSEEATRAAALAGELAVAAGGRVVVLAVVVLPASLLDVVDRATVDASLTAAAAEMSAAAAAAATAQGAAVTVDERRTSGSVGSALVAAAEELGADLIVVGRRGSGRVGHAAFGSVSSRVAATARCPVIVVPAVRSAGTADDVGRAG
jgi:nucleotide-binding universal stress UspA family protein